MSGLQDIALEDSAIQDTLSMTTEERLDLLANLIAEKIIIDKLRNKSTNQESRL